MATRGCGDKIDGRHISTIASSEHLIFNFSISEVSSIFKIQFQKLVCFLIFHFLLPPNPQQLYI